jgi:uncharacterized membrane protein YbhN (UPF0104 family)
MNIFKKKRFFLFFIRAAVAITLLSLLIWNIRGGEIVDSIARIMLSPLLLSVFSLYASILLGSFNQYILFQPILKLPFHKFILSYFKAFVASFFFPSQVGDASIIVFLKPKGLYYSQSFSVYLWDKIITFLIYVSILFLFLSGLMGYYELLNPFLLVVIFILILVLLYLILTLKYFQRIEGLIGRVSSFIKNSVTEIIKYARFHPTRLLINFSLTFVKIFLVMSCYYFIFSAFGYTSPFWGIGISCIASGIVAYLPISIQGIGTVEATAVWIFGRLEIGPADVLSGFLLLRVFNYALAIVVFGLICLIREKSEASTGANFEPEQG